MKTFFERHIRRIAFSVWRATMTSIIASVLLISIIDLSTTGVVTLRAIATTVAISATISFVATNVMIYFHGIITNQNNTLKALNAELTAFTDTAAHDLKGPINTIVGYVTLLQEQLPELEEADTVLLKRISSSTFKMAQIIDDLLLLAQARQEEIELQTLDMQPLIDHALARHVALIEEYQPEIEVVGDLPQAYGYAPWVEAVWSNYISNAIKYGGRPPKIQIGAKHLGNKQVQYWIKDNGKGIDVEDQTKLFVEFSKMPRIQGVGLGLSIVDRIIQRLNGEVGILESTSNGTIFYFTLPIHAD